jgi:hypothetical protein
MTRPTRKAPAGVSVPSLARRIRMRFAPLSLAICLAMCLPPARVFAQTDIWSGGAGLWSNASMWSTGVPTSSSNVFIDNGNPVASTVTLNYNGAQCGNLTIDSNDSLVMVDGTIFTLYGPTISNSGNISLESAGAGLDFNFGGAVTLTGAGTVTMSNNSANAIMGYAQPSPGASLTNKSTIQGAGSITPPGGDSFINQATVNANQTTALTINGGYGTVTNTGTLEATSGGTLTLYGGTLTNTGGIIHADPASIVSLSSVTVNGGMLTTSGSGTIQANCCLNYSTLEGVTLNGNFQLNNNNIGYLEGTITDNGSILIDATASSGTILDIVGAVTLKGTGTLTMSNNTNNALMGYAQASPGDSLTNQIAIQGAGSITPPGGDSFINQATVNANQKNPLLINAGYGTVTNTGTLEATSGGTLEIEGGTITNTGGIIHADPGSAVELESGVTISGGTLTTTGTGTINSTCCFNDGTLNGVTNEGTFQVIQTIEYLQGTITNTGSFQINAKGANTDLDIVGAVTLAGKGVLKMSNDENNYIFGYGQASPGATLTNQSTIEGAGNIGWESALGPGNSLINQGTISANQSKPLSIGVSSGSFTNTGTLHVNKGSVMYVTGQGFGNFSGSTLTGGKYTISGTLGFDNANIVTNAASITLTGTASAIINDLNSANALANLATNTKSGSLSLMSGRMLTTPGDFSNAGKLTVGAGSGFQSGVSPNGSYTQTAGTTTVDGVLSAPTGMNLQAGSLLGKGTIAAAVQSSGKVTPGDATAKPGTLTISGSYSQSATGSLNISIGGLTVGTQYDQLAVSNGVSLKGTLNLKLINSFVPVIDNTFIILTGSAISGTFTKVTGLSINSAEHFAVTYNPTNVTVTVVSGP